jgi:iron complex transport system ATP-binding protein
MILDVEKIQFNYPARPVLEDINFFIHPGEFVAVLGTNGTGKTTLLKCINRILKPDAGTVYLDKEPITQLSSNVVAQHMGYVEQQRSGSRTTVFNAVLLGRKPYIKWDVTKNDMEIASNAMARLGLSDYALRYLDELSGGELQKVVIARALAQEPDVLLMDEPTSSLDLKNQLEVLEIIREITKGQDISVLVTMHDINLALRFADRFILLKDKQVFAAGGQEVITEENIEAIYSVPVTISAYNGYRFVVPL